MIRKLDRMLLGTFVPVFLVGLSFFVLIIQLIDIFAEIVRYMNLEVSLSVIAQAQLLFLPKAVSYSLPVAILFAVSFTLGNLYSNNELIAVYGAGIPLQRFVVPFLAAGILLSIAGFVFEEQVVVHSFRDRNRLDRELLNIGRDQGSPNVTVLAKEGQIVYNADYYTHESLSLHGVTVIEREPGAGFLTRIHASRAEWRDNAWEFINAELYTMTEPGSSDSRVERKRHDRLRLEHLNAEPELFGRLTRSLDEMQLGEARDWVSRLRAAGLPYRRVLTEYYSRISFAFTPFIVAMLAAAVGSRFRKNVLLLSLLVSLSLAVGYYVLGMVLSLMSAAGHIQPLVAAWLPLTLFAALGAVLFRLARS
ncbi:MAG: YjgP/YjgQ family permease [Spirochaetaceae bacterium]|nr:MAG: YjgP/YjgQ family permease [Spirochaetaceae bacterium]